jgi:hemolysin-activating ACP:hemolysin acyltransferase
MVTIDTLTYDISEMDPGRIRISIMMEEIELGVLYFEKAKSGFINKPIGLNAWACVDAKIEGLYIHGGDNITPRDMVAKCQDLIRLSYS